MSTSKPSVTIPQQPAPTELVIDDITVGTGSIAINGKNVSVHYVGVAYSNGKQFDASWDRNEPFEFRLGNGQVIAGWDEGVALLSVGDKARFVIPSHLGYGAQGAGGVIPPNANLIFDVELVEVK